MVGRPVIPSHCRRVVRWRQFAVRIHVIVLVRLTEGEIRFTEGELRFGMPGIGLGSQSRQGVRISL